MTLYEFSYTMGNMVEETEEMKQLREQWEALDSTQQMSEAIGNYREKLLAIPKDEISAEQRLWLVASDKLFNSKFSIETKEGQQELADMITALFSTISPPINLKRNPIS